MQHMQQQQSVVWLTGATSGIGKSLALKLAEQGYLVAASGRSQERLDELSQQQANITGFCMDVTEEAQVQSGVDSIIEQWGRIDIAIFNAGDYTPMTVDNFDTELFKRLNAVNYLGVINCIGAILPIMRKQKAGQLLITASVAGYRGLPRSAPYGATKAALINLAETLRLELDGTGILVRVINPGFVKTPLTDKNDFTMPAIITPEKAAAVIVKNLPGTHFEITFPKRFTYWLKLFRCLPYRLYFSLVKKATG